MCVYECVFASFSNILLFLFVGSPLMACVQSYIQTYLHLKFMSCNTYTIFMVVVIVIVVTAAVSALLLP